jgi:branched-chain amino acid transport system substrate-binding protein
MLGATALLAATAIFAAGCGSDDNSKDSGDSAKGSKDPIVIGFPISMTGAFSAFALPMYQGAQVAAEDINKAGGVDGRKIELVAVDDESTVSKTPGVAQQVLSKGAHVVAPTCDYDLGGPAARVALAKSVLVVGCAGDPLFGKQGLGPLAFSAYPPTPVEAANMAQFAIDKGWKSAYILADTSIQYSKRGCEYVSDTFEELGGKIVGRDTFVNDDASVGPQVSRMRAAESSADVLFLCSYVPGVATAVKQVRAGGVKLPIVGMSGADGRFVRAAVPNLTDYHYSVLGLIYGEDDDELLTSLGKRYKAAGGSADVPDWPVIAGYGVVQVVAEAIKRADGSTDAKTLAAELEKFKDQPVVWGELTYSTECHTPVEAGLKIAQVIDGELGIATTVKPSWVPPYPCYTG